jgi:hypothetical protein
LEIPFSEHWDLLGDHKIQNKNVRRLLICRAHRLDVVRITDQAGEKLLVKIGDESIQDVEISTDMRDLLLHFISVAKADDE